MSEFETEELAENSDFSTQQQSKDNINQKTDNSTEEPDSENRTTTYWLAFVFIAFPNLVKFVVVKSSPTTTHLSFNLFFK